MNIMAIIKPSNPYLGVPLNVIAETLNKAKIPASNENGIIQKVYDQNIFLNVKDLVSITA